MLSTNRKHLVGGRGCPREIFPETEILHFSPRSEYKAHLTEGTAYTTAWGWHMAWPGARLKQRISPEVTREEAREAESIIA